MFIFYLAKERNLTRDQKKEAKAKVLKEYFQHVLVKSGVPVDQSQNGGATMIDSFVDTNVIKETKDLAARGRRSGAET